VPLLLVVLLFLVLVTGQPSFLTGRILSH